MIGVIIFLIVTAVALNIIFGILSKEKADMDDYDRRTCQKLKRVRWIATLVPTVLMVLVIAFAGIKIIDSTTVGVVKTFGKIDHSISGGLNFVNPITDTVTTYDLKVQAHEASFASYTKDAQPVTGAIEVQYSLNPAYILDIAQEYGTIEQLQAKLGNTIEERTKIVFARYGAMTLLENRSSLSAEVTTEVKQLEEQFNVKFNQVIVRDIDFSDAFEASVEAKMEAEQAALKAEQEKKTAVIKAEQEQEVARITAQAKVAAAQGEAEALKITQEALEKMPEKWVEQMYLEKWDGKLPVYMVGDGTSIMLTPTLGD